MIRVAFIVSLALLGLLVTGGVYAWFAQTTADAEQVPEFVRLPLDHGETLNVGRTEVTVGQWKACVADGVCPRIDVPHKAAPDHPVTKVNWYDAKIYVRWLAEKTGKPIRLPSKHEWVRFAADHRPAVKPKLFDDPRLAWAADYDIGAEPKSRMLRQAGSFGVNVNGISDLTGNVWEWTATCRRAASSDAEYCPSGRLAMGEHAAILNDLVRDPGNAGCGGGIPPANLGFRVVY